VKIAELLSAIFKIRIIIGECRPPVLVDGGDTTDSMRMYCISENAVLT
jgi:hypothetical protein